jgi:hypothetical protein
MIGQELVFRVDWMVFISANLMNLLLALMFYFRWRGKPAIGQIFGWCAVAMSLPLALAMLFNFQSNRGWPYWVLPLLTIIYCIVELLLDGIFKVEFRHNRFLWPYLVLYYIGLMAMIGYAFLIGKPFGFFTLITYFINLGATSLAYARVGHG